MSARALLLAVLVVLNACVPPSGSGPPGDGGVERDVGDQVQVDVGMDAGEEADVAPAGDATAEADMALEPDAAPCVPLDGDEPGGVGGGGGGPSVGVWAIGAELELADVTFELGPVAPGGASDINPGADGLVGEVYRP